LAAQVKEHVYHFRLCQRTDEITPFPNPPSKKKRRGRRKERKHERKNNKREKKKPKRYHSANTLRGLPSSPRGPIERSRKVGFCSTEAHKPVKMSELETFTLLPLRIDPQSKAISGSGASRALETELATLNALHRSLLGLEGNATVPPPPVPVNPKRSANVNKLRESGNGEFRKGRYAEAIKFYTLGLQMALTRPMWEPQQLVREEVHQLFSNRAQAHMAMQGWAEGAVDAEASVEAKRQGNAKAWWRRGRCLMEMGRLEEAREWVGKGLEVEGEEKELVELLKDIEGKIARDTKAE
jgi:translocation protein SEC72